jgi:hypothetical protein
MGHRLKYSIKITEFSKRVELNRQDIRVPHGSFLWHLYKRALVSVEKMES